MPNKIKIILMIFVFLQFFADLYILRKWRKYLVKKGIDLIYHRLLLTASILLLPAFLYVVNYRFSNPAADKLHFYLFLFFGVWTFSKLPVLLVLLIKDIRNLFSSKKSQKQIVTEDRRDFLSAAGWTMAATPFILTSNGSFNAISKVIVKRVNIPITNLDPGLDGFTIAQISDLHLGSYPDKDIIKTTISKLENLNADAILVTGDYVNGHPSEYENFYSTMNKFKKFDKVYGCLGNHDHYMNDRDHGNLIDMINSSGIELIINDNIVFEKNRNTFNLAAIDNTGHGQFFGDFDKTFKNVDPNLSTVLLAHDPKNWDKTIKNNLNADLTLSGHTHGGQVVIEFMGERFSPVSSIYKQWSGLYSNGDQHIYVNTGLGTVGPPIRIGVPPEITLIKLVRHSSIS